MAATIVSTHLLKSINQTMTVVHVTDGQGAFKGARVVYGDSFGNPQRRREFRKLIDLNSFVEEQLVLNEEYDVDESGVKVETGE